MNLEEPAHSVLTAPPDIPACAASLQPQRQGPIALWTAAGRAHVQVADGSSWTLEAGSGIFVPSDRTWQVRTDPGTVALPIRVSPADSTSVPSGPTTFHAGDEWRDWLVHQFALSASLVESVTRERLHLLDVLLGRNTSVPPPSASPPGEQVLQAPPMPQSRAAQTVASELLRDPASANTVEEWARAVACSARSLRRDFLRETGVSFAQWRLSHRLIAATELLRAGIEVGFVANLVGFGSRSGLTRAFRERLGIRPSEFAAHSPHPPGASARILAARRAGDFAPLLRPPRGAAGRVSPPAPAATQTAVHTNPVHVLIWMYRGSGYVSFGDERYHRGEGDALWLPAGLEHHAGADTDSIGLPLGDIAATDLHLDAPLRTHFPPAWNNFLLYCSVAARSTLRPAAYDPHHILDVFRSQFTAERARQIPMPEHVDARAVATEFLSRLRTPADSALTNEIHDAFRQETGMTFTRWQYVARMRVARDLLTDGARPANVARRVGYTQLSNFSRAFSQFHGTSPSRFQEQLRTG